LLGITISGFYETASIEAHMSASVSPLAPKHYPTMPVVHGVRIATAAAGIKYKGRTDVMLMVFDRPAEAAGVFTRSLCPSAPVDFCRRNLVYGKARAVVVNSGNANAFTGVKGREATEATAEAAAKEAGVSPVAEAENPAVPAAEPVPAPAVVVAETETEAKAEEAASVAAETEPAGEIAEAVVEEPKPVLLWRQGRFEGRNRNQDQNRRSRAAGAQ